MVHDLPHYLHVASGSVALATLWIPLLSKKGGRLHRRAGWVYVVAMGLVAVSTWIIAGSLMANRAGSGLPIQMLFLSYIGLMAVSSMWTGVRALKHKTTPRPHWNVMDLGLPATLALGGGALIVLVMTGEARGGQPLLLIFGGLGMMLGGGHLAYWLRPPTEKRHWWFEHMSSMFVACITTVTAFVVVNAPSLGVEQFGLVVWLAPSVVGVPTLLVWQRYYRRTFAQAASGTTPD